jgi:uncharacterized Zn-binding protein involved in type VI secretion
LVFGNRVGVPLFRECDVSEVQMRIEGTRNTPLATSTIETAFFAKGSTIVLIGGMPAARMGDLSAHGGSIAIADPSQEERRSYSAQEERRSYSADRIVHREPRAQESQLRCLPGRSM